MVSSGGSRSGKPDYFAILGLSRSASRSEIRIAYRALILKHHPDKQRGPPTGGAPGDDMAKLLNEAYSVLLDDVTRAAYLCTLPEQSGHKPSAGTSSKPHEQKEAPPPKPSQPPPKAPKPKAKPDPPPSRPKPSSTNDKSNPRAPGIYSMADLEPYLPTHIPESNWSSFSPKSYTCRCHCSMDNKFKSSRFKTGWIYLECARCRQRLCIYFNANSVQKIASIPLKQFKASNFLQDKLDMTHTYRCKCTSIISVTLRGLYQGVNVLRCPGCALQLGVKHTLFKPKGKST